MEPIGRQYDISFLKRLGWESLPSLEPISGIPELLERLDAANINVALASSARLQRIELFLNRLHLAHHVPIIVSADDIPHSEPAPDCYLRGAEILGIDPADCVAIEDAGNGVASAKAAGMKVIAYRAPHSKQDLAAQWARGYWAASSGNVTDEVWAVGASMWTVLLYAGFVVAMIACLWFMVSSFDEGS